MMENVQVHISDVSHVQPLSKDCMVAENLILNYLRQFSLNFFITQV